MGNYESHSITIPQPPVNLMITLEKSRYMAGEEVKGEIFIKIRETFGCTKLQLNLKVEQFIQIINNKHNSVSLDKLIKLASNHKLGYEIIKTFSFYDYNHLQPIKPSNISETKLHCPIIENKLIYNSKILIANFPKNRLLPGEYRYPITFVLPEKIPGSFELFDNYSFAFSRCILQVSLHTASLKNTIRSFYLIIVNQPTKFLEIEYQKTNSTKLKKLFFINKGRASLTVFIPKEYFFSSDIIIAKCELDNKNTSLCVNSIKVSLNQVIKLKSKNQMCKTITRSVTSMNYFYFLDKKKLSKFTIELPILDYNNPTKNYYSNCENFKYLIDKNSFPKLQGSIRSDLIDCSYFLRITVYYDGEIPLSVDIPIAILIPEVKTFSLQFVGSLPNLISQ